MREASLSQIKGIIKGNSLRTFPTPKRGFERLRPFPKPSISHDIPISDNTRFFVIGNCFARSVEDGLQRAGYNVLSSQFDTRLTGNAFQQFQRFNLLNLEVAANAIDWGAGAASNEGAALVDVDEEWVDLQTHFSFAGPSEEMLAARRIFNQKFAAIADCDVVVCELGRTRAWFDRETGLYLNCMPTNRLNELYPDRFVLREFDIDDMLASMDRICKSVVHCNPDARLVLAVPPVYTNNDFISNDILVDQITGKARQLVALDAFVRENSRCSHLPAWEISVLGDFASNYLPNSLHHPRKSLGYRAISNFINSSVAVEGEDTQLKARILECYAYSISFSEIGANAESLATLEPFLETGTSGVTINLDDHARLHRLYCQMLMKTGNAGKAFSHALAVLKARRSTDQVSDSEDDNEEMLSEDARPTEPAAAESARVGADAVFNIAANLLRMKGGPGDAEFLRGYAEARGLNFVVREHVDYSENSAPLIEALRTAASQGADDLPNLLGRLDEIRSSLSLNERWLVDKASLEWARVRGQTGWGIERAILMLESDPKSNDTRLANRVVAMTLTSGNRTQLHALLQIEKITADPQKLAQIQSALKPKA